MLLVNQLTGFGAGGGGGAALTVTHTGSYSEDAGKTVYTILGAALGIAAPGRKIGLGVTGGGAAARTVSTLTVAGIVATYVGRISAGSTTVEIWEADVPTGTTGDIVITWSGSLSRIGVDVFDIANAAGSTFTDSGLSSANPLSDSLTIPTGGVGIGFAANVNSNGATWANLTEDSDVNPGGSLGFSAASIASETEITPTISCTWATPDGGARYGMVLAAWGP